MESEASIEQFENSIKRVKDGSAGHIDALHISNHRENTLESSSRKVAKLNHKFTTEEVLIKHFQSQVNDFQGK